MPRVTFITGSQNKADKLAEYLGFAVEHIKLDLDEIQSVNPQEVAEHKVRQAYSLVKQPVLVEDTYLTFDAFGQLPGPFIKWFLEELGIQETADLLRGKNRNATAGAVFAYFDGEQLETFTGALTGTIAEKTSGDKGWGWDKIFIPEGSDVTQANAPPDIYEAYYTKIKPFDKLRDFLKSLDA